MHVAVAIVGFRNPEDILRCLDGLAASSYTDFEVAICENGGAEAVVQLAVVLPSRLASGQPVKVIDAEGNPGFAGGVNRCLAQTPNADAWWVLNPDTCPEPDTLTALVQRLGEGTCDAVGCSLRLPDGTIQSHGGLWHGWLARPVSIGKGTALSTPVDPAFVERKQNYLNGASMLIGRSFLAKTGPMREDYFLYCEEVEWCLRGQRRGVKLGFAPSKPMMHYQGTTTGAALMSRTAIYLGMRNKILMTRDLYPWRLPVAALFALLLHLIRYVKQGAWPQIGYGLAGFVAGVLGKRGVPGWLKAEPRFEWEGRSTREQRPAPGDQAFRGRLGQADANAVEHLPMKAGISSLSANGAAPAPPMFRPTFKHVILTRFNVRWEDDPNAPSIGLDPKWLSERFELFERYCLPSVLSQTERNFNWLLFFNDKTPPLYMDRVMALNRRHPFIAPIFCSALPLTAVQRAVRDLVGGDAGWLLTSRLDNDDGLHPEFVAGVQSAQSFQHAEVLNYPNGVIFRAGRAYRRRDLSNAFISLSEPMSEGQTVFGIPRHVYASDSYPVRQLPSGPMWLQVIHESNVSNRVRGLRIAVSSVAHDFPSVAPLAKEAVESPVSVGLENLTLYPLRSIRDLIVVIVRRGAKLFGVDLHRKAAKPRTNAGQTHD